MAAAGRLSPFQDEADLRAAPEDLSSASDSGSQTPGLQNGQPCLHGPIPCTQIQHPCLLHLSDIRWQDACREGPMAACLALRMSSPAQQSQMCCVQLSATLCVSCLC